MTDHTNEPKQENLEGLQDYVRSVLNDTPDEDWCQAARHRLQSSLESKKKENWIMNMIRNGQRGKLKWAVAVAVLAVIVILAGIIPRIGGTGLAFAQVVQRIQQIQTVTYYEQGGEMRQRRFYKAPSWARCEWVRSGYVVILDSKARKTLSYFPKTKTYFSKEDVDFGQNPNLNPLDRIAEIKAGTIETLPEKELAGRKVAGFKARLPNDQTVMATIWADVETGDPVQVEFHHLDGTINAWSDFQINVPLDDALFNFTPPEGYTFKAE